MRVTSHGLPVIKRALREGLSASVGPEVSGEAEGLHDGQVGKEGHLGRTRALLLREDVTTTAGEHTVDIAHGLLGHRDVAEVDRLKEAGLSSEHGGEAHTTGSGHDLSHTTVDGISMEGDIHEVEPAATHLLLTQGSILAGPGESTDNGLLDLKEVVDSLGGVDEQVGAGSLGSKGPDLTGLGDIPLKLISELASLELLVGSGLDVAIINGHTELGAEGLSLNIETVVLVGRLGETGLVGLFLTGLAEGHNGVGDLDLGAHEVFLEILEANLEVELAGGGDDVLSGLLGVTEDHGVGLGEALHALDELGEIGGVLGLDGATDDGGDGELHGLDAVGVLLGTDGSGLEEVLIDADEGASVACRDIGDLLGVASHHDYGPLDVLDPKLGLLAGDVVGPHDADLLAGGDAAGEDAAEGVEASLVGGGDHLGDVHTEGGAFGGVASADGGGGLVIKGTIVEGVDTVLLGGGGGGEFEHNHLKDGVSGREPLLHHTLEQLLANELLLIGLKLDANGLEHLLDLAMLLLHDGLKEGGDGGGDELAEGALKGAALVGGGPDLALGVEVPITPELGHHLVLRDAELGAVGAGEALEGEGPLVEAGSEGDGALAGIDLHVTEGLVVVHGNDHVHGLDGTAEGLVELLGRELELKEGAVHLVHHQNGPHPLLDGLTEHGLGLDAHAVNGVNHHQGTIRHTQSGRHLGREVDVTGRIDQVDQERVLGNLHVRLRGALGLELRLPRLLLLLGQTRHLSGLHVVLEEHRNARGLDGDAALGLVGAGVGVAGAAGGLGGDDSRLLNERIGQGRLAVIDVRDDGHGPDVVLEVHDGPHLLDREVHHLDRLVATRLKNKRGGC
mmetsp:Transcript_33833/g.69070  ORF Transcript_33833/g.69070 Transcript_33833/m.69070 type:complete len:847 (+) Transcript_33833:272-2812(+)